MDFIANNNMFSERFKNVTIELSKRYFLMFTNIFGNVNDKGTVHNHELGYRNVNFECSINIVIINGFQKENNSELIFY